VGRRAQRSAATPARQASRRAAFQEQVECETVAARQSANFMNASPDAIDDAIRTAMGEICETHGLDRCTLFRIDSNGASIDPISWERLGVPAPRSQCRRNSDFRGCLSESCLATW
jgi:hypothetical protein